MKIVGIFLDRRARFVIIIYNKDDDIRAAAPVAKPAGPNLDMLRPRRSAIASDRVERPELSRSKYAIVENAAPHRIAQSDQAARVRYARCDARRQPNQQLVFIEL